MPPWLGEFSHQDDQRDRRSLGRGEAGEPGVDLAPAELGRAGLARDPPLRLDPVACGRAVEFVDDAAQALQDQAALVIAQRQAALLLGVALGQRRAVGQVGLARRMRGR